MRQATLLFLIKKSEGKATDVCLAMKKRGFGAGRWNGAGGKVKDGETVEQALVRETIEEIGVAPKRFSKAAELHFSFANNPEWDQVVHAYLCDEWEGEPSESEEMAPRWFRAEGVPYKEMWPDDIFWLPKVLDGTIIRRAEFVFGDEDAVLEHRIEEAQV